MRISEQSVTRFCGLMIIFIIILAIGMGYCQDITPSDSVFLANGKIELKQMSPKIMYISEQINLILIGTAGFLLSEYPYRLIGKFCEHNPKVSQMAKPRGLFDGLDRETHFVGGFGLYYYLRRNGFSKANSYGIMTIGSLLWEVKDSFRFMDYRNEWFRKTSVGNVLIHAAGDGFDIQDHWCVMLGGATAVGLEYLSEGWQYARIRLFGNGLRLTFDL